MLNSGGLQRDTAARGGRPGLVCSFWQVPAVWAAFPSTQLLRRRRLFQLPTVQTPSSAPDWSSGAPAVHSSQKLQCPAASPGTPFGRFHRRMSPVRQLLVNCLPGTMMDGCLQVLTVQPSPFSELQLRPFLYSLGFSPRATSQ